MNRKMKVVYFSFSLEFFPSHSGLSVSVSGAAFATKSILMKPPKLIACRPGPAWHLEFTLALASLLNNIPLSLTLNILARHCYNAATPPTALLHFPLFWFRFCAAVAAVAVAVARDLIVSCNLRI